jgi:hypothetical protein
VRIEEDLSLPRASVITGRIADDLGDPVAEVSVQALRWQYWQGSRQPVPSGRSAVTNDAGVFRIFGLVPETYVIGMPSAPTSTGWRGSPRPRSPARRGRDQGPVAEAHEVRAVNRRVARPSR